MSPATVLVLGGGPAGAAAALRLARAGAAVTLVEREEGPREKVCGEFLGPDAALLLRELGLDLGALGAVPVRRARLAAGARAAEMPLPFNGWSLPRAVLDEALLRAAAGAGARVLRGRAAAAAGRDGDERAGGATGAGQADAGRGWAVRLADGAVLRASRLVLATGKHELRGHGRGAPGGHLGLKLPVRPRCAVDGVVLLPFAGGYAGLQPRPGGDANLCAALDPRAGRSDAARNPAALLDRVAAGSVLGAALLGGAVPLLPRPLAVAGVPYGFLHRDGRGAEPALFRVGDQFAVVPSLAGEGVAMALCGGMAAAGAILDGVPAPVFHAALRRRLGAPMRWAGLASALLGAAPAGAVLAARALPWLPRLTAARTRLPGGEWVDPGPVAGDGVAGGTALG